MPVKLLEIEGMAWLVSFCVLLRWAHGRHVAALAVARGEGDFFIPPALHHISPLRGVCLRPAPATRGCTRTCEAALFQAVLPAPSALFQAVLPAPLLSAVQQEVARLVNYFAQQQDQPAGEEAFLNATFWCPLRVERDTSRLALLAPRNAVEAAIEHLVCHSAALRQVLPIERVAGVEWWFHFESPADAPKEFHSDCDVRLARDAVSGKYTSATTSYPLVSSVLYLDAQLQRPTVVFDQVQDQQGLLQPACPPSVLVCFPQPNQLFLFRGDRRHAVFDEVAPRSTESDQPACSRRTVLINFWSERPGGAADLPAELARVQDSWAAGPHGLGGHSCTPCTWRSSYFPAQSFEQQRTLWEQQQLPPDVRALAYQTAQPQPQSLLLLFEQSDSQAAGIPNLSDSG
eukprot:g39227.t1